MDKYIVIIILFLTLKTHSQEVVTQWCPPGATWTYTYSSTGNGESLFKYEYEKDTMINTIKCKKINNRVVQYTYGSLSNEFGRFDNGVHNVYYLFNRGDTIYQLRVKDQIILYIFNSEIGATWNSKLLEKDSTCSQTTGNLKYSVKKFSNLKIYPNTNPTLIGRTMKILELSEANNELANYDYILNNIGSLSYPFPTSPLCTGQNIAKWFLTGYCDNLVGSIVISGNGIREDLCSNKAKPFGTNLSLTNKAIIRLFPNPCINKLHVELELESKNYYSISDMLGNSLISNIELISNEIDIQNLKEGIYYLILKNNEGISIIEKFIKE